jgi:hypothetical protein
MAGQGTIYRQRKSRFWWIAYSRNGRQYYESSKSEKRSDAQKLLNARLGEIATGTVHGLRHERVTFDQLAADLVTDYRINGKKSVDKAARSVRHLQQCFGGMRAMDVTTDRVKTYIRARQEAGVSNGEINRELAALKRMFNLALQQTPPKVRHKPYIPMLKEGRPRSGFFEQEAYDTLRQALPPELRPVITFAYASGWRKSEVLGLTWDRVDRVPGRGHDQRRRGAPLLSDRRAQGHVRRAQAGATVCAVGLYPERSADSRVSRRLGESLSGRGRPGEAVS